MAEELTIKEDTLHLPETLENYVNKLCFLSVHQILIHASALPQFHVL